MLIGDGCAVAVSSARDGVWAAADADEAAPAAAEESDRLSGAAKGVADDEAMPPAVVAPADSGPDAPKEKLGVSRIDAGIGDVGILVLFGPALAPLLALSSPPAAGVSAKEG